MDERSTPGTGRALPWLLTESERAPVETHHVWAPRPLGRSILWTPTGKSRRLPAGAYQVFVKQRALEAMYRHVWGASHADEPYGYLFGDLCEDRESQRRYVVIARAVTSAYPLYESESEQISAEAARAMGQEVARGNEVLAGWYHRHREGPVELSQEDLATHEEHFSEPWQVAFLFVTDPEGAAGGCFQPQLRAGRERSPLPFYEVASATSLLAGGLCKTRIDWQGIETEAKVLVDPVSRPEISSRAPEPVAEAGEPVFELAAHNLVSVPEMVPDSEVHFDLVPEGVEEESVSPVDLPADEESAEEPEPVAELEPEAEAEPVAELEPEAEAEPVAEAEPAAVAEPEPVIEPEPVAEAEPVFELEPEPEPVAEPEPEAELEPAAELEPEPVAEAQPAVEAEPEPVVEAEAEPEPVAEPDPIPVVVVHPTPLPSLDMVPEPMTGFVAPATAPARALDSVEKVESWPATPVSAHKESSPATPDRAPKPRKPERRGRWDVTVESIVTAAAILSVLAGAWPLRGGDAPVPTGPRFSAATLVGFVLPAREAVPAMSPFDESDALTPVGQEILAANGRYDAVSEMFARGRLTCASLGDAHSEVQAKWTAYGEALARVRDGRSEEEALRDEWVARGVRDVETDFQASGCDQP